MEFPSGKIIAFEGLDCSFKETNHRTFLYRFRQFFSDITFADISPSICKELGKVVPIMSESFPRYASGSAFYLKRWLQGEYNREFLKDHPDIVNSFYALDRFDFWYVLKNDIYVNTGAEVAHSDTYFNNMDLKKHGACFIFDRYSTTNAIYNPVGNEINENDFLHDAGLFYSKPLSTDIMTLSKGESGKIDLIPSPDIVVFMRMSDFNVLLESIANKKNKDKNELDKDFLYEVWQKAEEALTRDLYKKAGITVIPVNVLNSDKSFRTRENIAEEVWFRVMGELFK